eukprot:TRINITY_DN23003_c0_g2_i1.p1 TRINITY_DN23003_c0_g2~~TRINITY_DN23003_c0_g2_i1.p1  ORF type:complete len:234 (+),score=47.74 TRINITY_DN23003_c0_g2_i1:69-770(+)
MPEGKAKVGSVQDGVPEIDSLGFIKFLPAFVITCALPRVVGLFAARWIYKNGKTALYDKNIAGLAEDEGYVYAAAAIFGLMITWINNYPMLYKSMVMRFGSGNLRANMMIYKEAGSDEKAPYVVLETEGPVGSYNRANRSLTHLVENSLQVVLAVVLAGRIFALPTFFLTAIFAVGRVFHQVGYASIGYGAHAPGFLLASLSTAALEGLCMIVAAKNLGYDSFNIEGVYKFEL